MISRIPSRRSWNWKYEQLRIERENLVKEVAEMESVVKGAEEGDKARLEVEIRRKKGRVAAISCLKSIDRFPLSKR